MSGTGSRGKGSRGKRGSKVAASLSSSAASFSIPPLPTGRPAVRGSQAVETQTTQQRVADMFTQAKRRKLEEKDAGPVMQLMLDDDEQASEATTTSPRDSIVSKMGFAEECEMLTVIVGGESAHDVPESAGEEFQAGSSSQQLFEEGEFDVDDEVKDPDYHDDQLEGDVIMSDSEEEDSVGLARRISIAGIGRSSSGHGMRDPQPAAPSASGTTTTSRTTQPKAPTTTGIKSVSHSERRKGKLQSPIWQFFHLPSLDSKFAICKLCHVKLSRGSKPSTYGTSSFINHLGSKHKAEHEEFLRLKEAGAGPCRAQSTVTPFATPADTEACSGSQSSSVVSSGPSSASRASTKRHHHQTLLSDSFVVRAQPPASRRIRQLNGLLTRAMTSQLLPYSFVQEGSQMRALLQCAAPDWPIPSRHYFARKATPALHRFVKANVERGLDHAVGARVHVTMDSWSSRFGTGRYLCFTAHWVSLVEGGEERTAVSSPQWVVPPRSRGSATGSSSDPVPSAAKQTRLSSSVKAHHCQALLQMVTLGKKRLTADHVLAALQEQESIWLTPRGLRVGEVVADNGANLVAAIQRGNLTHIPCLAHVLNLVVQKFLRTYQGMDTLLGAARKTVGHFRRSGGATASLEAVQLELNLPRHRLMIDVPTRWNSTLAMLERLVEQRRAVNLYLAKATMEANLLGTGTTHLPDIILSADWGKMQLVSLVLAPFLEATNMVSRDHASLCEWVTIVCMLEKALDALLEVGEEALVQQEQQQQASQSTSVQQEEEEESEDLEELEVPDLEEEGAQRSAAAVVRGWREQDDEAPESEEDSTVSRPEDNGSYSAEMAALFPMAVHMLQCLRKDPRVKQMRAREDIWITLMLDPRLKGKLAQFLPVGGDPVRRIRDLQRILVRRLEEAFPQTPTPPAVTVQPAQQQVPASSSSSRRPTNLLSLTKALYATPVPLPIEEVPALASGSQSHNQHLTRMVADYMGSYSGLDTDTPVDPLEYWVKHLDIWSELAQYALEVLSCPPSSVMSERCFSAAGGVVTEKRSCLCSQSVDRLTFLKMNQAWAVGEFLAPVVGKRAK